MHTLPLRLLTAATCLASLLALTHCQSKSDAKTETATAQTAGAETPTRDAETPTKVSTDIPAGKIADNQTILSRPQVPILCYHQIRDWRGSDSQSSKDYIVPTAKFAEQMQMLADSGYHTILPDELYAYLTTGAKLPSKPVMLTFDDGDLDQYTTALPILDKHKFKAAFFIMTVAIGRRGKQPYMDKDQIADLVKRGHAVGCHTWDHHNVKKYQGDDWKTQIEKPNEKLKEITGQDMKYFAYPFGLWNKQALPELKKRGYLAAFTLADGRDPDYPLLTIRRIIAGGQWSAKTLARNMVESFDGK